MGGGGSKTESTSTSGVLPLAEARPYYRKLFDSAQTAFGQTPKTPYTGNFLATPNAIQQQAVAKTVGAAPGLGTGVDALRGLATDQISGKYLDPKANPYLQDTMRAAIRPMRQDLTRNILPGIASGAQQAGAYGGSRQGILEGNALEGFGRSALDTRANIAFGNYANERNIQQQSPALLGQANALALAGPQALAAAGDQTQKWDQDALNNALMKWNEVKTSPWAGLGEFANILGTGGFQSTSSKVPSNQPSPWMQAAQMGLAIPSALSGFGLF